MVVAAIGVSLVVAAPVPAAAATLDSKRLAKQVTAAVAPAYPDLAVVKTACPKRIPLRKGAVATCTVDASGISLQVTVTQTNKRGAVTIAAAQAVLPKAAVEQFVRDNTTLPAQVTVDCGPAPALVKSPGETFTCAAAFADGSTEQVTISVADVAGNVQIVQVT